MKVLILILTGIVFFSQSALADEGEYVVFRDIKWGEHVDSIYRNGEKLEFIKTDNAREPNAYRLSNDNYRLGTVRLKEIHYIFNSDDRFTKVYMTASREFLPDMNFILNYRFGSADEVRNLARITLKEWHVGDVRFILTEVQDTDHFTLNIESRWEHSESYRINTQIQDF
jgi:hypothetical protein